MPPAEIAEDLRNASANVPDGVYDKKWCSSFPQCVADDGNSAKFMCRAMFVAFSTVIRYRKLLGEECFKTNYITEKLKIRSLSFDNKQSLGVSHQIRGASAALKDGYLEELALVITEKEGDEEVLEVFSWKMHYDMYSNEMSATFSEGSDHNSTRPFAQLKYDGTEAVRDQLVIMVRSIQVICHKLLAPLPENVKACFRVSYTPQIPENYIVDGFTDSETFYKLPEDCQSASLGQLRPGHHISNLTCYSTFLADSYQAELTLKKHAEKIADSLGYQRPNTMYTSFLSNESSNTSLVVAPPMTPATTEGRQTDEESLTRQVECVRLNGSDESIGESASVGAGRKRKGRTATAGKTVTETPVPVEASPRKRRNYARVRSTSRVTPEN